MKRDDPGASAGVLSSSASDAASKGSEEKPQGPATHASAVETAESLFAERRVLEEQMEALSDFLHSPGGVCVGFGSAP